MNHEAHPGDKSMLSGGGSFLSWMLAVLCIYLLPFIAVVFDELVLKTYWFAAHSPPWVVDVMRASYPFWTLLDK